MPYRVRWIAMFVVAIASLGATISIPLIIMVLLFQKRIVAGLTAGAVKG